MGVRLVGINHVALDVGDIDAALEFYGSLFDITLRGRGPAMAFIDMGDQFIALSRGRSQPPDEQRHFGLVVDDREALRRTLSERGIEVAPEGSVDFNDPWGNHILVVDYRDIQFAKTPPALRGVGGEHLTTRAGARREMEAKGLLT
jgi:catechol 2,3-dioxygenase-like lactoylglutathione lyase family enzyme